MTSKDASVDPSPGPATSAPVRFEPPHERARPPVLLRCGDVTTQLAESRHRRSMAEDDPAADSDTPSTPQVRRREGVLAQWGSRLVMTVVGVALLALVHRVLNSDVPGEDAPSHGWSSEAVDSDEPLPEPNDLFAVPSPPATGPAATGTPFVPAPIPVEPTSPEVHVASPIDATPQVGDMRPTPDAERSAAVYPTTEPSRYRYRMETVAEQPEAPEYRVSRAERPAATAPHVTQPTTPWQPGTARLHGEIQHPSYPTLR